MERAHRHFIPGQVWHLTHRCYKREFLLKFARDRASTGGNGCIRSGGGKAVLAHGPELLRDLQPPASPSLRRRWRKWDRPIGQPAQVPQGRLLGGSLSCHGHRGRCGSPALRGLH